MGRARLRAGLAKFCARRKIVSGLPPGGAARLPALPSTCEGLAQRFAERKTWLAPNPPALSPFRGKLSRGETCARRKILSGPLCSPRGRRSPVSRELSRGAETCARRTSYRRGSYPRTPASDGQGSTISSEVGFLTDAADRSAPLSTSSVIFQVRQKWRGSRGPGTPPLRRPGPPPLCPSTWKIAERCPRGESGRR